MRLQLTVSISLIILALTITFGIIKAERIAKLKINSFGDKFYEAFEKDIALVEIYFPNSKAMKLKTQAKMKWIDYLSTVRGLLGLVLVILFAEIFWLCLRIAALKLDFQDFIP